MTEAEYLASEDPRAMYDYLESQGLNFDWKWWHFVGACRIKFDERYPNGPPWIDNSLAVILPTWLEGNDRNPEVPDDYRAGIIREIWGNPFREVELTTGLRCENCNGKRSRSEYTLCADRACNGWMKVVYLDEWLTPKVIAMAQQIHDTQDWGLMPIFADLLEDAGCDNEDVLRHARGEERCPDCMGEGYYIHQEFPGRHQYKTVMIEMPIERKIPCSCNTGWIPARCGHVSGCWVISLILGEE